MSLFLLAQDAAAATDATPNFVMQRLLEPDVLCFLVPIVGVLVWGLVSIVNSIIRHRERIAMIENGLIPPDPGAADGE